MFCNTSMNQWITDYFLHITKIFRLKVWWFCEKRLPLHPQSREMRRQAGIDSVKRKRRAAGLQFFTEYLTLYSTRERERWEPGRESRSDPFKKNFLKNFPEKFWWFENKLLTLHPLSKSKSMAYKEEIFEKTYR